jgi:uncharacterized Zn-binding protein involved in type VI secretion
MTNVARIGQDTAGGGVIIGPNRSLKVNGYSVACLGDSIAPHGEGIHASAVITEASSGMFVDGKRVARKGDACSCGHVIDTGSENTFVG